jgi:hypothetical protein
MTLAKKRLTINVPVAYMARDVVIFYADKAISRAIGRDGPRKWRFFFLGGGGAVAISGLKKVSISGSTSSNDPRNEIARMGGGDGTKYIFTSRLRTAQPPPPPTPQRYKVKSTAISKVH